MQSAAKSLGGQLVFSVPALIQVSSLVKEAYWRATVFVRLLSRFCLFTEIYCSEHVVILNQRLITKCIISQCDFTLSAGKVANAIPSS
jgi:hypothetical protein